MSEQEILTKAIRKAIEGGWDGCHVTHSTTSEWLVTGTPRLCVYFGTGGNAYYHPNEFIFNHDFAKALWSKEIKGAYGAMDSWHKPIWQYHLQQMVIAENPIKYLGENI